NNPENMAEFSTHGPTGDGLMKPNVVAPGGWYIWSADNVDGGSSCHSGMEYMGGTSMATPTCAGMTALIRQYFTEGYYPSGSANAPDAFIPTGALMKAMLILGTRNMTGSYTIDALGNSGHQDAPSNGQGWGRVILDECMFFDDAYGTDSRKLWVHEETPGLGATGNADTFLVFTGGSATETLKVVMSFTDYPGDPAAGTPNVNDLHLTVKIAGSTYKGNVFAATGARSITGGSYDEIERDEVVWLDPIPNEVCSIIVSANAIRTSPQPYALAVAGDIYTNAPPLPPELTCVLFDNERQNSLRPTIEWKVPSDNEGEDLHFRFQWDDDSDFDTPLGDVETKDSDPGFAGGPFPVTEGTGNIITYTFQSDLADGDTLWWRVCAWDGINYGGWSGPRSFAVNTPQVRSDWYQTTEDQFNTDSLENTIIDAGSIILGETTTLIDDFNDGNYTVSPTWNDYYGAWAVVGLTLTNGNAFTDNRISTPFAGAEGTWECEFRHEEHNANPCFVSFFFMTNTAQLSAATDGYSLNSDSNTGSEAFTLYRWDNGSATAIIDATVTHDTNWHTMKVTRDAAGNFEIFYDGISKGTVTDATYSACTHIHFRELMNFVNDRVFLDDVRGPGGYATSGTIKSTPIYHGCVVGGGDWDKLKWNQTLNGESITFDIQKCVDGVWSNTALTGLSAAGDGDKEIDISALDPTTEDSIRIVGNLSQSGGNTPRLNRWSVSWKGPRVFYVRNDGDDGNAGTGPLASEAWETITHAATQMNVPGDIVYVAPGNYPEEPEITYSGNWGSRMQYLADTDGSEFPDIGAGAVNVDRGSNTDGFIITAASYITIDGFTINNSNHDGIYIEPTSSGNCEYIEIKNCVINTPDNAGINLDGGATSNRYLCNYIEIHDNIINDAGDEGIIIRGGYDGFIEPGYENAYNKIYNNKIDCNGNGIDCSYGLDHTEIYNNEISTNGEVGISLTGNGAHNLKYTIIYNNMIYDSEMGIDKNNSGASNYSEIYNNSFYTTGTCMYWKFADPTGGDQVKIKNNIFYTTGSSSYYCLFVWYGSGYPTPPIDYNHYYRSATDLNYAAYTTSNEYDLADFANWQADYGFDIHSTWGSDPQYTDLTPGAEDLHIASPSSPVAGAGIAIPWITEDIDGDTRADPPYIGADENTNLPGDAGISAITAPTLKFCPGTEDIIVTLNNYSDTYDLNSCEIHWAVDEGAGYVEQPMFSWSGSIPPLGSQSGIDIGDYTFTTGVVCKIKAWTENANGSGDPDLNPANDECEITDIAAGLTGTFTIGGASPDYATFTDAVSALVQYGVCGPVIFNARDGTYNERIEIPELDGASAVNTVTFQSESGDSSLVIMTQEATGVANNYTVRFSGADYITIQKMTLEATDNIYCHVIEFDDTSCNNQILNNQIFGHASTSISTNKALVYSDDIESSMDDNNTFRNNWFKDGSYGMYYQGWDHVLEVRREHGTVVENNVFENSYYGIYISNQDDIKVNGNYVTPAATSNNNNFGIYLLHCYNEFEMVGNTVILDNTGNQKGVYLMSCDGDEDGGMHYGLVANNMITSGGGSTSQALYSNGTKYKHFYYNSFHCTGSSTTGGSKSFYINGPSNGHNDLKNNIFTCLNGTCIYNSISSAIENSDYNDYYSEAPDPDRWGYWGGAVHNLAEIQAASGDDANSMEIDPGYVDPFATATDLHLKASSPVIGQADPVGSVTDDIDGDTRDIANPDIGADENQPSKVWTGNVSIDWDTDGNWNPVGVPDHTDGVLIPADPESDPDRWPTRTGNLVIGGTVGNQCASAVMEGASELTTTADLTIDADGVLICGALSTPKITVEGNWTNNGTFT
ncbi:hypothetical protein DRQ36_09820, partial [bacterium]